MARNPAALARALTAATRATTVTTTPAQIPMAGAPYTPTSGTGPLLASYGDWMGGRVNALPRQWDVFQSGMFGPLPPMVPMPIDAPPSDQDQPEPRRFIYPVSWNMPHGVPGDEGLKLAPFSALRTIAAAYSVAQACVRTRIQEILGLDWNIVPTKDAEKKMRGDQKARREFDARRAPVKRFFDRPDPDAYFSFTSWLGAALNDVFVVDALSLYIQPPRKSGKGVGGSNLAALNLIDGTTIRPMLSIRGEIPRPPNPAYQQYAYGVPRVDLVTLLTGADVRTMGDAKIRQYSGDRMLYLPMVTQTNTPYGFPPVERALTPILSGMSRQNYQSMYFQEGSIPGAFLSVGNPDATPGQCRQLQDAINAMAGDQAWKHKIIVIPGGGRVDPMRPVPLSDSFDDLVMTQVTMAFDVMPMELGITPRSSTTTSPGAQNQMAKASENVNNRKALKPLLKWLKEIFDAIIHHVIGYDDMAFHWEGLEEGDDETASIETQLALVGKGALSIDEMRVQNGHQPWGLPITSEPVFMTATDVIPLSAIDMKTGKPIGAPPPQQAMMGGGLPSAGGPSDGGSGGDSAKRPQPAGGGAGGGTPAHAGAAALATPPSPQSVPAHMQDLDEVAERAEAARHKVIEGEILRKTGDGHGHHVPGTPNEYSHGWKPLHPEGTVAHLPTHAGQVRVWHDPDDGDGPRVEVAVGSAEHLHSWDEHITTPWQDRVHDDESRQADFTADDLDELRESLHQAADAAAAGRKHRSEHYGSDHGVLHVSSDGTHVTVSNRHLDDLEHFEDDARDQLEDEAWEAHWATHPPGDDDEDEWTPSVSDARVRARAKELLARHEHPSATLTPDQARQLAETLGGLAKSATVTLTRDAHAIYAELITPTPPVDVPAAQRELDLIRRRLNKGRTLDGWQTRHLPSDAWAAVAADPTIDGVNTARAILKTVARRARRDPVTAPLQQAISTGLRTLADLVADGELSTLGFVDHAVELLRTNIGAALQHGVDHALNDTPAALVKADGPVGVEGLDPRFQLYAGTAAASYELGYGLATLGAADDPDNLAIRWHPRPDACELCAGRGGEVFTVGTLPGWPGDGGFGKDATVCLGGPNCRCTLSFEPIPTLVRLVAGPAPESEPTAEMKAMREALAGGDPAAITQMVTVLAAARAEKQRPFLLRLIKDILTAIARKAGLRRLVKGNKTDPTSEVYDYLAQHYPGKVLGWVRDAKWTEPEMVRLSEVDMGRRPGGRNPQKVEAIAAAVRSGKTLDPIVLVDVPGEERLQIADGYHRTLGRQHAGKKRILAYVGTVDETSGPWDRAMHDAKLNKTAGGNDHWMHQPRDPSGEDAGQWISMAQTAENLAHRFGDLVDEQHIGDHTVQAHDGGDGHVLLTTRDGEHRRVTNRLTPDDARALADQVEEMAEVAEGYNNEDEPDPTEWPADTSTSALADGTYVRFHPEFINPVQVLPQGSHDDDRIQHFDQLEASELAEALRDMADRSDEAATDRQEREEEERLEREEREQEERERAEAWWEDVTELFDNNGLSMDSPTTAIVEDVAWSGAGNTTVPADEMLALSAAIREMHRRGGELPEWEPNDDDDEDPVDDMAVSDRLTLQLLADGEMLLSTYENGTAWDTVIWRDNALELADGLDALHAQILAAPKPAADLAKGDGWMHQIRVPHGEHGGEWTHSPGSIGQTVRDLARTVGDAGHIVARQRLAKAVKSGESDRSPLHGGVVAETQLVTFRDGTRAVDKKLGAAEGFGYLHGEPHRQADAEQLGSLVADALGVPAPALLRTDSDRVLMSYVDGKVGADVSWRLEPDSFEVVRLSDGMWLDVFGLSGQYDKLGQFAVVGPRPGESVPESGRPAPYAVMADRAAAAAEAQRLYREAAARDPKPDDLKEQGLRIGLLDLLIGNGDRNDGNWIQTSDGRITAIDHAGAWNDMEDWPPDVDEFADFGQEFRDDRGLSDHPLTRADMDWVRAQIAGLEGEFDRLGRRDWWTWTMDRVELVTQHATGTRNVIV